MTWRRTVLSAVQLLALAGAALYLWRAGRDGWSDVARFARAPEPAQLLAASLLTVGTYGFLVATWVTSLAWWGQRLAYGDAARIWFLTNLSRFVPGAIWQFAGMSAMAMAHGVSAVAATGAVLLQQVVLLGTGVVLTLAFAPRLLLPASLAVSPVTAALAAVAGAAALTALLPLMMPVLGRFTTRVFRRPLPWPAPRAGAFAAYVVALLAPWLAYGVAFWLFGRAFLGESAPGLMLAVSAFISSYVAGILVVIAPAGLGVREAALVAALSPSLGGERALFLALASRLWLVLLEIISALIVTSLPRPPRPALQP